MQLTDFLVKTSKELPDWMAEQELEKNMWYWLPYITGMVTIPHEKVEYMTGRQRSILNAAARMRLKLFVRGGLNG